MISQNYASIILFPFLFFHSKQKHYNKMLRSCDQPYIHKTVVFAVGCGANSKGSNSVFVQILV